MNPQKLEIELTRREFLRAGCLACCAASVLSVAGCGSEDGAAPGAAAPTNAVAAQAKESPRGTWTLSAAVETPADKALVFQAGAMAPVVVFQVAGKWRALSAKCTHSGCTVDWHPEGKDRLICPCHDSRFDENGKVLGGPAKKPLPTYAVRTQGDDLVVVVA